MAETLNLQIVALRERVLEAKAKAYYAKKRADDAVDWSQACEIKYAWAMRELEKVEKAFKAAQVKNKWGLW